MTKKSSPVERIAAELSQLRRDLALKNGVSRTDVDKDIVRMVNIIKSKDIERVDLKRELRF